MPDPAPLWVSWSAAAIRALPFGRYQLANVLARFASRPFVAKLPDDLGSAAFVCDLHDAIAREVCFTGRYEPQETQLAMQILGHGMTVLDVGANWGYFSLVSAHLVGCEGRGLALEPHPRLHAMLAGNIARNGLSQIEVLRLAAGAASLRRTFVGFDERDGNWGLSRAARDGEGGDFECETTTLDALLGVRGIDRVDMVKIDIEGGEAEAIRGMADGLRRRGYRHILLECHPAALDALGSSIDDCLAPLRQAGYRGWRIDHSLSMHKRAAAGPVPLRELLTAADDETIASDPWPHLLWIAPGEPLAQQLA